jgi:hypothetical protein
MRGGKRKGAGRKNSAPTKMVRMPVAVADAARAIAERYLELARSELENDIWYKSCPDDEKSNISLRLTGIVDGKASSIWGLSRDILGVEAIAEHPNGESRTYFFII